MTRTTSPRRNLKKSVMVPIALGLMLAACGSSEDSTTTDAVAPASPSATSAPTPAATESAVTSVPVDDPAAVDPDPDAPDLGRVVSLGEEFVLADLLALGVTPVASTATVETAGFQGADEFDTSGIEVLPQTTLSLEYLASLRPDTIVTLQFFVDEVGADVLEGIAEVIVIPDGLPASEQIDLIGDLIGRPQRAAQLVDELSRAATEAEVAVGDDCTLSLATVYPGPTVAAFVDGPTQIPSAFQTVGCEIIPGPTAAAPDANGRAWLSEEQYGLLDQDLLVLMQNDRVDGEQDALAAVETSPLWSTLPAVQSDGVVVVDRLAYPGATGLTRLYADIPEIVKS